MNGIRNINNEKPPNAEDSKIFWSNKINKIS